MATMHMPYQQHLDPDPERIELLDNWHREWPRVLRRIEQTGHREALMIDEDGWLSARQGVFAAFKGQEVAGYLGMRVRCQEEAGKPARRNGRPVMQAVVDCLYVDPEWAGGDLEIRLRHSAAEHARRLCEDLSGFEG